MPDKATELLIEFKRIFAGAQDKFTIHVPPFTHDEQKNKLQAKFCGFAKYGKTSFKEVPDGFEHGDFVPVTLEQYRAHLNGEYGLALSPLIPKVTISKGPLENVCAYGIIDIDVYAANYAFLVSKLYQDGFKFVAFISKSGGLHIYFMFSSYEPAIKVRAALHKIADLYGLHKLYRDEKNKVSKVEIFPEHDECKPGVNNKGVFLPFYNAVGECNNKMLSADGALISIMKAFPLIKGQFTTIKELETTIAELPYSDAPYCIQAALLSGALYEGSHRNDFMFTTALYLKMKHGKDALTEEMIQEANERLEEPLSAQHITNIFTSVTSNDYPILGQCKKEPMITFCDKKACKERKYSAVKKDKGNVSSNVEFGQVFRMKAENPYYLLEARLVGTNDEFKTLRVDAAENFLNQRTIQKECIDKLGQVMWTVKQQVWEERLNEVMLRLQERDVPRETDTTELSDLRSLFNRYLTHRQAQSATPFRVTLKQVYVQDDVFYFQTDGLKDYLRIAKYTLGRTNLREELVRYGCAEGEITYTKRDGGTGTIKCWMKPMDDTLADMTTYFDEVVDQDAVILEQNKLNKQDKVSGGDDGVEDTRF